MASKRTVQFEFLVEADARQIDRFHDSLKRIQQTAPVSESVLTSLREELGRFAATNAKTENSLQGMISALRDASRNADLSQKEYIKLRTEVGLLEREYKDLTTGIVGVGKAYEQAGRQAEAFNRRATKIAERQQYMADQGRPNAGTTGQPQVARDANGNLIGFPGQSSRYAGMGDMGFGQFGPAVSDREWKAVGEFQKAKDRKLELNRQYHQQLLDAELRSNAQIEAAHDAHHRAVLADNQRRHEKELADFDRRLENRTRRREARRRGLGELRGTAASVGAGLFFGGPEGLIGSTIGAGVGLLGGPGGMAAGAAIGASAGLAGQQLRMQATMVSDLVAQLNLAKTALAQVSSGQAEYNQRLEFARQVSADYSVGLQATIEGYSKVTAAAAANGLTLKETETIYRGMIASGVAFGASQADLESIIRATTQVLSKGRVSMEEIGQQIGERIPGAVAKFAQATGRSLSQLAKDFEQGKVNMQDFVKFTQAQLTDYDAAARIIGDSPEKAGERLQLALTRMAELYGVFFQRIGAEIQDAATALVNWVNSNIAGFARVASGVSLFVNDITYEIRRLKEAADIGMSIVSDTPIRTREQSAQPGQFSISDNMRNQSPEAVAREQRRVRQEVAMLMGWSPSRFGEGQGAGPGLSDATAAGDDKAAKKAQAAAEKAQRQREQLESEERRRAELLANNAIRLADRVFEHQQSLIRRRYDLEQELIEATRRAQEAALVGPARDALSLTNRLAAIIEGTNRQVREGRMNVEAMQQRLASANASAANRARFEDVPPSMAGSGASVSSQIIGLTGGRPGSRNAGQSTGPHLDVRWADRRRITAADADRFLTVNGRAPSSFGVTSPYGPRRLFGRSFHAGIDFGTPEGGRIGLRNGATFAGSMSPSQSGGGGLTGIINTPMGQMKILHLERILGTPQAGRTQPGVAAGRNRFVTDLGDVQISQADLDSAKEQQKLLEQNTGKLIQQRLTAEILGSTEAYRTQTQAIQDQLQELKLRNRLQAEGVKPEIIDQQVRLSEATLTYNRNLAELQNQLANINKEKSPELYKAQLDAIEGLNKGYREQIAAQQELNALTNQRPEFNLRNSLRSGIDGYIESIGTLDEAVQGLAQRGFGGLSDAIGDLATTGTADFKAFAMSALADMAQVIFQQMVVANLMQAIRGLFGGGGSLLGGGGASGFGVTGQLSPSLFSGAGPVRFAKGGILTEHGPLKALPYARGGIASTSQVAVFGEGSMPEAFVPLPDGRRIPVNLQLPFQRQAGAADAAEASPLTLPYAKGGGGGVAVIGDDKPLRIESGGIRPDELPFVTYEQHQRGMAQAAAAGEARTLARIRNSPVARRRAGV